MSLRDSYFNGPTGLQQQMDAAFQAGIAYVGAGLMDQSLLELNGRTGTNLSAGSGQPGLYFTCSTPTAIYCLWMSVAGEIAPTVVGAYMAPVSLLLADTSDVVAQKIAAVLNALPSTVFAADANGDVVDINNTVAGVVIQPISVGTLGGSAKVDQVQAGVNPTGNYLSLQSGLTNAAAQGLTVFTVTVQGTGAVNAGWLRANNGNNLLLKSFFSGIQAGLADQNIYSYQCRLILNTQDRINTNVDFHFDFANASVQMSQSPYQCGNPQYPSGGSMGGQGNPYPYSSGALY
jgi:hypothetical protein